MDCKAVFLEGKINTCKMSINKVELHHIKKLEQYPEKYIKRKPLADILELHPQMINYWYRMGYIVKYIQPGTRSLYNKTEIINFLKMKIDNKNKAPKKVHLTHEGKRTPIQTD